MGEAKLFLDKLYNNEPHEIIGKGGNGTAYLFTNYDSVILKVANKLTMCPTWNREYQIMELIKKKLKSPPTETVKIVLSSDYYLGDETCSLTLPRVYPVRNSNIAIHPQFGEKNRNSEYYGRGLYLGIEELGGYLNPKNMPIYCRDLGRAMGRLHYEAKVDALDIEVIIGYEDSKEYEEKDKDKIKLFIIDFDQVKKIDFKSKESFMDVCFSFEAVPYFPYPYSDSELYRAFSEGYLSVASKQGKLEYAEKVLEGYI